MLVLIIVLPILVILLGVILYLYDHFNKTHDFECPNCGTRTSLSFSDMLSSPHMMNKCSVKCPGCGEIVWAAAVRKSESPVKR
jgi:hypothetical protein